VDRGEFLSVNYRRKAASKGDSGRAERATRSPLLRSLSIIITIQPKVRFICLIYCTVDCSFHDAFSVVAVAIKQVLGCNPKLASYSVELANTGLLNCSGDAQLQPNIFL